MNTVRTDQPPRGASVRRAADLEDCIENEETSGRRSDKRPIVAVVGGGITGLAAAHRLVELAPEVKTILLEAGSRLGGVLKSVRSQGFLLECGADNFITLMPEAVDLCRRIGFDDQLVRTNSGLRQALVVRKSRLRTIPDGFVVMAPSKIWPMISTPILSPLGKFRMMCEYFVRTRTDDAEESLGAFVRRRFGRELYDRLIQPLVGSIYASNPDQLSLKATLPRFIAMEQEHGSLIRGAMRERTERQNGSSRGGGAPYSLFVAPKNGMSSLVDALADRLPRETVQLNSPVHRVARNSHNGWTLSLTDDSRDPLDVDAVVMATPAHQTAKTLAKVDQELSTRLTNIPYASSAIVTLGYRREQIAHPLNGFGFVVPRTEQRKILSASFSSIKYPGRAPDEMVLIRAFIGGAAITDAPTFSNKRLGSIASDELADLLKISGQPTIRHIARHFSTMPQCVLGHCDNIESIESRVATLRGIELAGNAYHGVGVPNCIQSGQQAAERVLAQLGVADFLNR